MRFTLPPGDARKRQSVDRRYTCCNADATEGVLMKAIVIHAEKDLRIEEFTVNAPEAGEVQITMASGGICGSDLHYYNHGGIGSHIRVREPLILGHEVAGYISALGAGVSGLSEGDLVAVSPSRPCGQCRYCTEGALQHAKLAGADRIINTNTSPEALEPYTQDKGHFDVLFECSGAAAALAGGISAMRPGGVIMQLGLSGDMSLPMMALTAKELELRGSFRFHSEFEMAVNLMKNELVSVKSLITHTLPLARAEEAFLIANDRSQAMKAQIDFAA